MPLKKIWCLYGYIDDDIEPTNVTYALTYSTLPIGGWKNQGMVEKARTLLVSEYSSEYYSAINNTRNWLANYAGR